ncbi:glycoside hydrolase family 43 protein [Flammeovirga kamogawensis]|uniref:Glycoside hydrolase family 43 protein n=1 Tax=Flammeovirga kamogawensis TaxID=373891 RepID=A0ABX8H235_9BACT|nr:glycoside hydrolase family 43 protein [Flammeovirga kamogawensis]MBB6462348.1 hypothetical protein [Flammeovirga kamogawensis]QWG09462.1 glycoside hydrolase family 43 protein [Flammeovirga kamogawensis]TRX64978.1 family 43 glycosylhydrolase [Flammeovirga kamogawensis]
MINKFIKSSLFLCAVLISSLLSNCTQNKELNEEAYLFTYFTGNKITDEKVHFALSTDGYTFTALNNNSAVLNSKKISKTGGVRDPHILRGENGVFYMALTDMVSSKGWDTNRGLILLKSKDLINWSSSAIHFPARFKNQENLKSVWAPQTIYDKESGKYIIYWSSKYGTKEEVLYYAFVNSDFTDLEGYPTPLFIPKNKAHCIDGDIIIKDDLYYLFYKTSNENGKGIKVATATSLTANKWKEYPNFLQKTDKQVEGSGIFKRNNSTDYILMYDLFQDHGYEFCKSKDLLNFVPTEKKVKLNFSPRHGTILPITGKEYDLLLEKWGMQ